MKRIFALVCGVGVGLVCLMHRAEPAATQKESVPTMMPEPVIFASPVRPQVQPRLVGNDEPPAKEDLPSTLASLVTDGLDHAGLDGEVVAVDCSAHPCLAFARVALDGSPLRSGATAVERMAHAWDGPIGLTWASQAVVEPSDPGRPYALWQVEFGAADVGPGDAREEEYSGTEQVYLNEAGEAVAVGVW